MKTKAKYVVYIIIILILSAVIPGMLTNAKYIYNVDLENDITIRNTFFKLKQKENEPEIYEIMRDEEITAEYELVNFDENNNVNETNLKYYIKITDDLDNENLPLEITIDGYDYIEYKEDENGNIINSDGDITDEFGNILQEQNLEEEENEELQETLHEVKKGYGPINLAYDGVTETTESIDIKIMCPAEYMGDEELQFKIVIIAEGEDINLKTESDLKIEIIEEETNNQSNSNEEPQQNQNEEPQENLSENPQENNEQENPTNSQQENTEPQQIQQNEEEENSSEETGENQNILENE